MEKKGKTSNNFVIRTISSVALFLILLATLIPGGIPLFIFVAFAGAVGMMEFLRVAGTHKTPIAVVAYIALAGVYALIYIDQKELLVPLFMLYLLLLFSIMVFAYPKYSSKSIFMSFSGLIYVGLGLSFIYQTRAQLEDGKYIVWMIFTAWVSDMGAYCMGKLFGKRKAFPVLSPKKSIAGCIGGIIWAMLAGIIYNLILHYTVNVNFLHLWQIALICGFASILAQLGDLAASAIKRDFDVKDYGKVVPGHGGILDRFDSIIFVAPLVYYLAKLFQVMGVTIK
ncbi:MAG: phosphatidate cytidylyltransferase [Lachnospiraceae bacterium]|nr:phosphatidate cytidylyltransferase [Lachnospiraceae bacterium]